LESELISFQNVVYSYPNGVRLAERFAGLRGRALDGVTFSVHSGSAIALLGGNGSGKSTLLQLCNGLLVPNSGTVSWRGNPMDVSRAGLSGLRSQVGLLFQDPDDQIFAGTLFEDVAFGPRNQGLDRLEVRERVEEALEIVGLSEYADLPPHVLSHGMRKRLALAGILAMRPRLMLLDEPTAGLDPKSEEHLVRILTDLVAKGTSVVLSTHDLELARSWAGQAMILADGRVAAFDRADRILSNPDLLASCRLLRRFETPTMDKGGFL
jgi:cobalt/nickel transport system ATP-binding protein